MLEARNIDKIYESRGVETQALRRVSLAIGEGEFTVLAGPSGSGKTTLLNLFGALDDPTAGEILLDGQDLGQLTSTELADLRLEKLGFVFQAFNLIPVLSAAENVEFVMELQGVPPAERRDRALKMLADVGLEGLGDKRPLEMSGGQQQRVAVARAIVSGPRVVLADEPTANLDSKTAVLLLDLMRSMNRERGVTFVFSTHDSMVIERADRVVQLRDGEIVADGPGSNG